MTKAEAFISCIESATKNRAFNRRLTREAIDDKESASSNYEKMLER